MPQHNKISVLRVVRCGMLAKTIAATSASFLMLMRRGTDRRRRTLLQELARMEQLGIVMQDDAAEQPGRQNDTAFNRATATGAHQLAKTSTVISLQVRTRHAPGCSLGEQQRAGQLHGGHGHK